MSNKVVVAETTEENQEGAFVASLKRNNRQIRADRAEAIAEDAQITYRRAVEDLELKLKRMRRERENMLDLSPADKNSLMLATDFDSAAYVAKDIELGTKIRNTEIQLEIAQNQYRHLFGGE